MEQKNKDNCYKFKIIDFQIDVFDRVDADGEVHLKDESKIDMTIVTNVPIHTCLSHKENVENHMRYMFVSLVNYETMKKCIEEHVCQEILKK